jgi:hypothetical protein
MFCNSLAGRKGGSIWQQFTPVGMTLAPFPVPPIVKTVTVRAAPARAFALLRAISRAGGRCRESTGPDPVDCAIEPRPGGRVVSGS